MNTYLIGTLWLVGISTVVGALVLLKRRYLPPRGEEIDNGTLGGVFSLAGMLFAIVAAFVFIDVWGSANEARDATYREAEAVQLVTWTADSMAEPARSEVRELCRSYLRQVIDQEWAKPNPKTRDAYGWQLVEQLRSVAVQNSTTTADAPGAVQTLMEARQDRISLANRQIGDATWFALIAGALLATIPMLFFPFSRAFSQFALTATVVSMITLLLFTIQQIERPFSNDRVTSTAYQQILSRLNGT
jgi:hypothetical protein